MAYVNVLLLACKTHLRAVQTAVEDRAAPVQKTTYGAAASIDSVFAHPHARESSVETTNATGPVDLV